MLLEGHNRMAACFVGLMDGPAWVPLLIFHFKFSPQLWDVHFFGMKPSRACAAASGDPLAGCGVM